MSAPAHFNFWRTVYSHGWCTLPPFQVRKDNNDLIRILRLNDGTIVHCILRESGKGIRIDARSRQILSSLQRNEVRSQVRACFRLDEDLSEFHDEVRKHREYSWITKSGSGRLLRSPSVFEDVVKMICTTNCTWALTEIMVENLVGKLGEEAVGGLRAFPAPEALAGATEAYVRKQIKAGYRSPYLIEFAGRVASGSLDVEAWRSSSLPTPDLFREIQQVKGMGPYATGNLLRLLGRYDYLALDSWVRAQFARIHHNGRRVSDRTIEKAYRRFGKWRGLFFWFEMTKQWLDDKFPF